MVCFNTIDMFDDRGSALVWVLAKLQRIGIERADAQIIVKDLQTKRNNFVKVGCVWFYFLELAQPKENAKHSADDFGPLCFHWPYC